jgi:hypothetical protein
MERQTPRYFVKQARDESWDVIDSHAVRVVANRCDRLIADKACARFNASKAVQA